MRSVLQKTHHTLEAQRLGLNEKKNPNHKTSKSCASKPLQNDVRRERSLSGVKYILIPRRGCCREKKNVWHHNYDGVLGNIIHKASGDV